MSSKSGSYCLVLIVAAICICADVNAETVEDCLEYGDHAWFSPEAQRCIVPLAANCSHTWPPTAYQCGLSQEGGVCGSADVCRCRKEYYKNGFGKVSTCLPKRGLNEACTEHIQCDNYTWCEGDQRARTCQCGGGSRWSEQEASCYGSQYKYCDVYFLGGEYDRETGRCYCPAGRVCGRRNGNGNGNGSDLEPDPVLSPEDCPHGTNLLAAGNECACPEGLIPMYYGRVCVPALQYKATCGLELELKGIASFARCVGGSRCIDGVCQCLPGVQIWNPVRECCLLVSGGKYCNGFHYKNEACTPNTECDRRTGTCVCPASAGFKVTSTGECLGGLGAVCTSSESCVPALSCMNGKCECRDLLGQFYDDSTESCISLVGGRCELGAGFGSCVDSAVCDPSTHKCICPNDSGRDLVPTPNRARCFKALGHGERCTTNECDFRKGLTCDISTGTDTGTAQCVCVDSSLEYSANEQACVATRGGRCGRFEVPGSCEADSKCEYYHVSCGARLKCVAQPDGSGGPEEFICCHANA